MVLSFFQAKRSQSEPILITAIPSESNVDKKSTKVVALTGGTEEAISDMSKYNETVYNHAPYQVVINVASLQATWFT
jgi:hypothetical protein